MRDRSTVNTPESDDFIWENPEKKNQENSPVEIVQDSNISIPVDDINATNG